MILVRDFDYSDAVIDGHSAHGVDILPTMRAADPTNIDELRLFFLYPEIETGKTFKMNAPSATPMMKLRKKSGAIEHFASDGTEYLEAAPAPIHKPVGDPPVLTLVGYKRWPWKRESEKACRPGRARREQTRMDRLEVAA